MKKGLDVTNLEKSVRVDFPGIGTVVVSAENGKIIIESCCHTTGEENTTELDISAPTDK